jgi:uncharacterized protein (TIGR03067 family)
MLPRLLIAVLTLVCLTAFAPAPFPRARRDRDHLDLNSVQGTWRVVSMQRSQGNRQYTTINWHISHIRIDRDEWTFLHQGNRPNALYYLSLDPGKKPGHINWHNRRGGPLSMAGLIRRNGEVIEILYLASTIRPGSFEDPPANYYLLTLKRENS